MKKKYLILASFAFSQLFASAQTLNDTTKNKLSKSEIELVYNHYQQNGNNSAVTGGIGTEKLTVFGPSITQKNTYGNSTLSVNLGIDVISSASTDNIDYVVSSASSVDRRFYINGDYSKDIKSKNLSLNGGLGLSGESDYLSLSGNIGFTKKDKANMRSFSARVQILQDDLRWGRGNPGYYRPVKLIYPSELRYKDWYEGYKRNSYIIKLGFTQLLNKRNTLGFFPEFTFQQGLLATPFHRVYFSDGSLRVENLPNIRFKTAAAIKLNTFVGGRFILKNTINGYTDNFGIQAISVEHETVIKLKPSLTLLPAFRIYSQQGSRYFKGFQAHSSMEEFYTSDYDLSDFQRFNIGLGVNYSSQKYVSKKRTLSNFLLRYTYSNRSNNLQSHIFSLIVQTSRNK